MRRAILIVVGVLLVIGVWKLRHHGALSHAGNDALGGAPNVPHSIAPDFSLQDLDGQPLALGSYRGKVVLLDFWATWCAPCRTEIPHFVAMQDKYGQKGLQVIGISMDDGPKPVREFYHEYKMNYPVAVGTEQVAEAYGGVFGLPITFLIGRDGRIAAKYTGAVDMGGLEQAVTSLLQGK